MCWKCDMRRLGEPEPEDAAAIQRGGALVAAHMREHNVSYQDAVEALTEQRRQQYAELAEIYGARHGLDADQVQFAFWAHGINGPEAVQ